MTLRNPSVPKWSVTNACNSISLYNISTLSSGYSLEILSFVQDCIVSRGTQWIVSVNYLFGRPLIPSDFRKRIVTSNFREMRNLMSVVFRIVKNVVLGTKKRSAII